MPGTDEHDHVGCYAEVEIPPYMPKDAVSVLRAATIAGVMVFRIDENRYTFYLPLGEKQDEKTLLERVRDALGFLDIPPHVFIKVTAEATA